MEAGKKAEVLVSVIDRYLVLLTDTVTVSSLARNGPVSEFEPMRVKSYSNLVAFSRISSEESGRAGEIVVLAPIGPGDPR